jgi:hypothetical protein
MKHLKLFEEYKTKIGFICTTFVSSEIDVVIPKKKADGYLKSAFGGINNTNDRCREFLNLSPDYIADVFDTEGYLSISIKSRYWSERKEKITEEIKNILLKIFPYVTDFKEIGRDEFYEIIMNR